MSSAAPNRQFRFLLDPLFLVAVTLYFVNRMAESHHVSVWLLQFYLNDLLCLAFWMPILLGMLRGLRLRQNDLPPTHLEMTIGFAVWAWAFECWLPNTERFRGIAVADAYDVVAYAIGGVLAYAWWWRRPASVSGQL